MSGWSVIDTDPPIWYCGDCGERVEPEGRGAECPGRPVREPKPTSDFLVLRNVRIGIAAAPAPGGPVCVDCHHPITMTDHSRLCGCTTCDVPSDVFTTLG